MKRRLTQALGGGLVFATFGCAWAEYGTYSLVPIERRWMLAVPLAIAVIMVLGLTKLQRRIEALPPELVDAAAEARDARGRKLFTVVNIGQGIAIFLSIQVWTNLHRPEFLAPTVGVIVGLHFLALARPMEMPSHRVVGALMCLLALATMIAVPSRQWWAVVVGLGNGLILWVCYAGRLREVLSGLARRAAS